MRVRIIKDIDSVHGTYQPGQVANLPDKVAEVWMQKQVAMQDKSLDGASETKVVAPRPAPKHKSKKRTK